MHPSRWCPCSSSTTSSRASAAARPRLRASRDVTLPVAPGEFVAVMGPQRLRQEHAAAPRRRARDTERRLGARRRTRARRACRPSTPQASCGDATSATCSSGSTSFPSLTGDRERDAAARARGRRRSARPGTRAIDALDAVGSDAAARSLSRRLLGRPAATHRDRPGDRRRAPAAARRRADRLARHGERRRGDRAARGAARASTGRRSCS